MSASGTNGNEARNLRSTLRQDAAWAQRPITVRGRVVKRVRYTGFFADHPGLSYQYCGCDNPEAPWSSDLLAIKARIEDVVRRAGLEGWQFKSAVAYGHDGRQNKLWFQAEDDPDLVAGPPVASVHFEAERRFAFRQKGARVGRTL